MNLAVVGSRNFTNRAIIHFWLQTYANYHKDLCIVSGGARGVDSIAEEWADANGIPKKIYPADWHRHGKSAGYKRNHTIWDNADAGIAFWDGHSRGTAHSFELASNQRKSLQLVLST